MDQKLYLHPGWVILPQVLFLHRSHMVWPRDNRRKAGKRAFLGLGREFPCFPNKHIFAMHPILGRPLAGGFRASLSNFGYVWCKMCQGFSGLGQCIRRVLWVIAVLQWGAARGWSICWVVLSSRENIVLKSWPTTICRSLLLFLYHIWVGKFSISYFSQGDIRSGSVLIKIRLW